MGTWSYSSLVPDAAVFFKLFGIAADFKFKKQIIMTTFDFEQKVVKERIRGPHNLALTGDKVRILWNKEESTFSVNGSYR